MKKIKPRNLVLTALFAAFICVATMTFKVTVSFTGGYFHLGDVFIYLAAVIIGTPYSFAAASLGASLADLLSGFGVYCLPTFIIKSLMIIFFSAKREKIFSAANIFALIFSAFVNIAGYYLVEVIFLNGDFRAAVPSIYGNFVQSAASVTVFIIIAYAVEKTKLRDIIFNFRRSLR